MFVKGLQKIEELRGGNKRLNRKQERQWQKDEKKKAKQEVVQNKARR